MSGITSFTVLGHNFRPMKPSDFEGIDAEAGSFITETANGTILIFNPVDNTIVEIDPESGTEGLWKMTGVR